METGPIVRRLAIEINLPHAAAALQLTAPDLNALFSDGVFVQPIVERWAARCFNFSPRESRNRPTGDRVMVLTAGGISFLPSSAKGMGRSGGVYEALDYLNGLARLFVADLAAFPRVSFWELNLNYLVEEIRLGVLGCSLSRDRFLLYSQQPALFEDTDLVRR